MQESREMYLETILLLSKKKNEVHSVDVAEEMGFSKPSVSRAVSLLRKGGYVTMEESGALHLTAFGKSEAEKIYERHTILTAFFKALGVDENIAVEDACKIEHYISDVTFEAVKEFCRNYKAN